MVLLLVVFGFITYLAVKFLYGFIFGNSKSRGFDYREGWFGKGPAPLSTDDAYVSSEEITLHPFKISVPDDVLSDLQRRLDNTRFHEPLEDVTFTYGFNPKYLREVVEHWRTKFDWKKQEKELNQFPHFKTTIEGLSVHFMHIKPNLPEGSTLKVIPLMVIHGWPGSFVEFYKLIPLLTTPRANDDYVFEVVCPSIPGYGFSEGPHHPGFESRAASRMFVTLMKRIGHHKFYVQGGDWGSIIATNMARFYPEKVFGLHVNMFGFKLLPWDMLKCTVIAWLPFLIRKEEYRLLYPLKQRAKLMWRESAYFHMQSTKPDTLGCALADSPAGLAAYLLEKFSCATNMDNVNKADGGLTEKFTMDELLTNIMIYWVNNSFTAGARFYKENMGRVVDQSNENVSVKDDENLRQSLSKSKKTPVTVPSAVAVFPHEVLMYPKVLLSQQLHNLVSYKLMPVGGHFAAMEEPELLSNDIWNFVSLVEKK